VVDDVNDPVALVDVPDGDFSHASFPVLQDDVFPFHHDPEFAAGDGGQFGCSVAFLYEACELFGVEAAGYYMIGEDARERRFIPGFYERFHRAFGQPIKCFVGWGEDRKRACAFERFHQAGGFYGGYQGPMIHRIDRVLHDVFGRIHGRAADFDGLFLSERSVDEQGGNEQQTDRFFLEIEIVISVRYYCI
jgi:hypothetical protein